MPSNNVPTIAVHRGAIPACWEGGVNGFTCFSAGVVCISSIGFITTVTFMIITIYRLPKPQTYSSLLLAVKQAHLYDDNFFIEVIQGKINDNFFIKTIYSGEMYVIHYGEKSASSV